jgi:hypothetical protein
MTTASVGYASAAGARHQRFPLGDLRTAYLKNKGLLEHTQMTANHVSPRTTRLYDRRSEEITVDEVEKIAI